MRISCGAYTTEDMASDEYTARPRNFRSSDTGRLQSIAACPLIISSSLYGVHNSLPCKNGEAIAIFYLHHQRLLISITCKSSDKILQLPAIEESYHYFYPQVTRFMLFMLFTPPGIQCPGKGEARVRDPQYAPNSLRC